MHSRSCGSSWSFHCNLHLIISLQKSTLQSVKAATARRQVDFRARYSRTASLDLLSYTPTRSLSESLARILKDEPISRTTGFISAFESGYFSVIVEFSPTRTTFTRGARAIRDHSGKSTAKTDESMFQRMSLGSSQDCRILRLVPLIPTNEASDATSETSRKACPTKGVAFRAISCAPVSENSVNKVD